MHVTLDLGFPSLVLTVCLVVVSVFGFVIRGKWRRSVARQEEIKRLLVLASEEAARAELEDTLSYYGSLDGAFALPSPSSLSSSFSSTFLSSRNQCAVCFCPTTTRCANCKAVRYCSGKCQIIHWRQGHKEECRPFSKADYINENGRTSTQKVALQEQQEVSNERFENASVDTTSVESNLNNSSSSSGHVKNKDDHFANEEGMFAASESSGGSFSGFSTSPVHSGSSDDVSVGESTSTNETEGSEGHMFTDASPDVLEHSELGRPSSPKFASLVDSVDGYNKSSVSNHGWHPSSDERESNHAAADSSSQSAGAFYRKSTTKHGDSSGFWGRTLDSVMTSLETVDDSASANLVGNGDKNKSHTEPLLHANPESKSDVPFMQVQGSPSKGTMPGSKAPAGASKAFDRTSLSEKPIDRKTKVRSFLSVSCEGPNHVVDDASGDSDLSRSSEHKAAASSSSGAHLFSIKKGGLLPIDAPEVNLPALSTSERSNFAVNDSVGAPHLSKVRIQSTAPQSHLAPQKHDSSEASLMTSLSSSATISSSYVGELKSSVLKVVDQLRGPKCGRYNDKGLFSYDLFVKLYTSNKLEMKPFGLINCGNSCYANAVLQCLAFTPPLTAYFAQGLHSEKCVSKGWCFTCEFESLILKAKEEKSPLSPIRILSQLQHIGSQLSNGQEEDAHEFLRYSIDTMQSVCLKEAGTNSLASLEEETTLVGLTFGGYLHSKIRCLTCQCKSERQERIMDLAVEIGGDIVKLEDALRQFTSSEILDGDNKYQCGRCKSKEKAKKKLTILEAPNVLTIALKRFQSGKFGKLNKSIRFSEILNLAPYMSGTSDKSPIYRLYGVIVHLDVMNAAFSGHYVCYVKDVQNKWFKVDDSTVTRVDLDRVLSEGAYMLLYSRCSPRAPGLIRNSIIPADLKNRSNPSRMTTKSAALKSRSMSPRLNVAHSNPCATTPESVASVESFYLKFHRVQKILEEDASSDSFSFTSSNSDEGSCSTDGTRDSACADDLSDYIFGSWNSGWRNSNVPSPPRARWSKIDHADSTMVDGDGNRDRQAKGGSNSLVNSEGNVGNNPLSHPDTFIPNRKLVSSSSCRETDSVKLGSVNPFSDVKSGVSFRRSISERTD